MSINDAYIQQYLDEKRLFEVPLLDPEYGHKRRILATAKLMEYLEGSSVAGTERRFVVELRQDLDRFLGGHEITVGGPKHKSAHMKPLARSRRDKGFSTHEVWEFRSIDPSPSIRVFGRFAQTDIFVATDWEFRTALGDFGSLIWRREIRRCKHDWNLICQGQTPHSGSIIHDYISHPVVDLRNP